jgi:two-component system nitrate/nitrite response regulator NarL
MIGLALLIRRALVRAGLVSLLNSLGFRDIVEAASLDDLTQYAGASAPDIILVGLTHSESDVLDLMSVIRAWAPGSKVVFLAADLDLKELSRCFAAGASGYLSENISGQALEKSLALVSAGEKVFPSELVSMIGKMEDSVTSATATESCGGLSSREMDILRLLVDGRPNKVIAAMLNISESTAKLYVRNIMRKLRTANRTQTALWALRQGIIAEKDPALASFATVALALGRGDSDLAV